MVACALRPGCWVEHVGRTLTEWVLVYLVLITGACLQSVIGFGLGVASLFGSLMATKFKLRQLKSQSDRHQQEIKSLRSLPIKDDY